MEKGKNIGKVAVDEKYEESTNVTESRKEDVFSWGFFALVGCVIFALYEIIRAVVYFF